MQSCAGGKIASKRAVSLMLTAMRWKLPEVCIAKRPLVFVAYLFQFVAPLGRLLLCVIGPKRALAAQMGTDVYSADQLLKKKR